MASKRSLYGGGDRERDRRTRQWRTARIERFTEIQRRKREWINFAEIAEHCSEESGIVPNEVARETAYEKLLADLLEGDFEENGVSLIKYLHPHTSKARMTPKWMIQVMEIYDHQIIISQYLAHCWIPRRFLERWLAKHRMQPRPERFEPKSPTSPPTTQPSVTQVRNTVTLPVIVHPVSAPPRKGRYGPEPGTLRRYAADDRRLFPELKSIMNKERKSLSAAALDLAQAGRIAGIGTPQSRAKRLAALYKTKGRNRRRLTSC
jgi:hypothetical protein